MLLPSDAEIPCRRAQDGLIMLGSKLTQGTPGPATSDGPDPPGRAALSAALVSLELLGGA